MSSPNIDELREAYIKGFEKGRSLAIFSTCPSSKTAAAVHAKLEYPNIVTIPNEVKGKDVTWRSVNGELQYRYPNSDWIVATSAYINVMNTPDLEAILEIRKNPTITKILDT